MRQKQRARRMGRTWTSFSRPCGGLRGRAPGSRFTQRKGNKRSSSSVACAPSSVRLDRSVVRRHCRDPDGRSSRRELLRVQAQVGGPGRVPGGALRIAARADELVRVAGGADGNRRLPVGQGRFASLAPACRAQSAPLARLGVRRGSLQAPDGERCPQVGVSQALIARSEMEACGRPKRGEVPERGNIDRGQHPKRGGRCLEPAMTLRCASCWQASAGQCRVAGKAHPFFRGRLGGNH